MTVTDQEFKAAQDAGTKPKSLFINTRDNYSYRGGEWEERPIIGETSRSWLVRVNTWSVRRVSKKDPSPWQFHMTREGLDQYLWAETHRSRVARMVEQMEPVALRRVADAIGYHQTAEAQTEPARRYTIVTLDETEESL